ncbi:class I SAM-dependent methyltransferase [Thiorhodospira sibirica]|uniref:class I SAM-dependent methyltransferase n=1 Tax=Thiorhodospira sibirica TaxID=154347 RepID=UPI00022C589E|nr:SAM-dependent methyltransferase [Thiorhodospira sibirica]
MSAPLTLPAPDASALVHSEHLRGLITAEIEAHQGWLPFRRYMELALYAPMLGYYVAHSRKFGRSGDFVTAPEVSPLFARCLARSCEDVLTQLGGGMILELGAGSGALATHLLQELAVLDALPERYLILEISPDLRQRQAQRLASLDEHLRQRVCFITELPAEGTFSGLILANEVLDAMPVERFCVWPDIPSPRVKQLGVVMHNGAFDWQARPAPASMRHHIEYLYQESGHCWPAAYCSEYNPMLAPWIKALADSLHQGLVLLIDYGYPRREYYAPQRTQGTLLGYYRHRVVQDLLLWPGLMDLTAHVDFTTVAEAALDNALALIGYTTQAWFLLDAGLEQVLAASPTDSMAAQLAQANEVKRLTLPGEMGERFQVMGLGRGLHAPIRGFNGQDLRSRL